MGGLIGYRRKMGEKGPKEMEDVSHRKTMPLAAGKIKDYLFSDMGQLVIANYQLH